MKENPREVVLSNWKRGIRGPALQKEGIIFVLDDFLNLAYDNFYRVTKQCGSTGTLAYRTCQLHYSGDGYKAYMWIESYFDLMKEKEFCPMFVDIVCSKDYKEDLKWMFGRSYSIAEDFRLLQALGEDSVRQDNAAYIIAALEKLEGLLHAQGILFRQINSNDMKLEV
ncbi:hypothetical protein [Bacillus cereus]|uniref:Protein kinase domain-containing protein n=1 Tax=Bacillus cereus TaxID=1396 RepID=A0AAW5L3V8_BACCE|nr:hypothetical protein [Bacillus cereus]MCQ6288952.1 hypothetical protein [Bacillus cereus]MCQ6318354.1 hypothetical protein [Bacillus cereus]MCQ6330036.1 hypothetical protein [Bacillus cereus]MCQ6385967.1 hypothetical protein [Bacillus cereus]